MPYVVAVFWTYWAFYSPVSLVAGASWCSYESEWTQERALAWLRESELADKLTLPKKAGELWVNVRPCSTEVKELEVPSSQE